MEDGSPVKAKMSGYLEKKGRLRMVSTWKKYWFVLEGRLLLYYRSKDEYDAISPCKGSINLGPPCTVKSYPSVQCVFQIETRANTITLRAETAADQKKWMQAIMSALNQNQSIKPEQATRLSHFRYSLDDLVPKTEPCDGEKPAKKPLERQNTMPNKLKLSQRSSAEIIQRLQKIGAQTYGGSLGAIAKATCTSTPLPKKGTSQCSISNGDAENPVQIRSTGDLKISKDNIYERISGDSAYSQYSYRLKSFMVDNDNYSVPLKKRSSLGDQPRATSVLVENDQYCFADPARLGQSEEAIYAEPKINETTDYNKNSVLVENSFYQGVEEARKSTENEYEDVDKFMNHYSTPVLQPKEETSSQSSQECKFKDNKYRKFMDKVKFHREEKRQGQAPLKKSQSFIKRVWKRKGKKQEKKEEEEEIYEEVDKIAVEKVELNDGNTLQMLSELHNILENKRPILKKTCSHSTQDEQARDGGHEGRRASEPSTDKPCPSIPPKTPKLQALSPYHDVPKNNQLVNQDEPLRSIDEILEDLNKDKVEQKTKVKMLIEKFNEAEGEHEVTLRKHPKKDLKSRHSDELNQLLNELAKVTCAPIMTPGVTSSLVNPNLTDEEWLKLLPIRQRRLSEPDYDIPRPHKSIQLPPTKNPSDIIPATRFFGPVLSSGIAETLDKDESLCPSMTPDSLEAEDDPRTPPFSYVSHNYYQCNAVEAEKWLSNGKEDVIYAQPKPYISVATHVVNTCPTICATKFNDENTIIYKNVRNIDIHQDEVFKDSLELCTESLTEF